MDQLGLSGGCLCFDVSVLQKDRTSQYLEDVGELLARALPEHQRLSVLIQRLPSPRSSLRLVSRCLQPASATRQLVTDSWSMQAVMCQCATTRASLLTRIIAALPLAHTSLSAGAGAGQRCTAAAGGAAASAGHAAPPPPPHRAAHAQAGPGKGLHHQGVRDVQQTVLGLHKGVSILRWRLTAVRAISALQLAPTIRCLVIRAGGH